MPDISDGASDMFSRHLQAQVCITKRGAQVCVHNDGGGSLYMGGVAESDVGYPLCKSRE